jgi:hypothetical protein
MEYLKYKMPLMHMWEFELIIHNDLMKDLNMQSIFIYYQKFTIAQYALPPILCFNKLVNLLSRYGGNDNDFEPIFD